MLKTLLLILPLIATIHYCKNEMKTPSFYDRMTCANCSDVNKECEITTTGWSCDYGFDAKKLIEKGNSSKIPSFLTKCMLPGMEFVVEESIFGHCCIWSPEIGCQKLKKVDRKVDHCYLCTRATYSSLMVNLSCPCGEFFHHNVSRGVMLKPWNFLFIKQAMFIVICSLQIYNLNHFYT